MRSDRREI